MTGTEKARTRRGERLSQANYLIGRVDSELYGEHPEEIKIKDELTRIRIRLDKLTYAVENPDQAKRIMDT